MTGIKLKPINVLRGGYKTHQTRAITTIPSSFAFNEITGIMGCSFFKKLFLWFFVPPSPHFSPGLNIYGIAFYLLYWPFCINFLVVDVQIKA
jgi:hypothetical protein